MQVPLKSVTNTAENPRPGKTFERSRFNKRDKPKKDKEATSNPEATGFGFRPWGVGFSLRIGV